MTKYRTIVADPPWPIKWTPGSDKIKGGAWWNGERVGRAGRDMAYETMSVDAIGALNVGGMAEDKAALFLWSTRKLFRVPTPSQRRRWFPPFAGQNVNAPASRERSGAEPRGVSS